MSQRLVRMLWMALAATMFALAGTAHAQDGISFGQTIEEQLDASDPTTQDGTPFDAYPLTAQGNQFYVITGNSAELPLYITLYRNDEQNQMLHLIQSAFVNEPGRQVQYSGVIEQPGSYLLFVQSADPALMGAYSVSLFTAGLQAPGGNGAACTGGTRDNPVPIEVGATLSCELTADDVPFQNQAGDVFFGKFFLVQSSGGALTLNVDSAEIAPFLQVYADPASSEVIESGEGQVTVQTTAGPVAFAVINLIPLGVGGFDVTVSGGGTP